MSVYVHQLEAFKASMYKTKYTNLKPLKPVCIKPRTPTWSL